jgi:hypothetical protein
LNTSPVFSPVVFCGLTPVCSDLPFNAVFTVAIYSSALQGLPRVVEVTLLLYSSAFQEALLAVAMAAATCFAGSWGSKAKNSTAPCGRKWPKTDAKRNALPRAGVAVTTQPSQQRF